MHSEKVIGGFEIFRGKLLSIQQICLRLHGSNGQYIEICLGLEN